MTTNQINYFKVKVEEQHYKNLDAENQRHNVVTETQNKMAIDETKRTNLANEAIKTASLQESVRHNTVTESQTWANLAIQQELANSNIALQESQRLLNDLEATQRELNNSLNAKYSEIERVLGTGSGKGSNGVIGTIATVNKVVTSKKQTAVPQTSTHAWTKQSANTKAVSTPVTNKVAHKETAWYYGKK